MFWFPCLEGLLASLVPLVRDFQCRCSRLGSPTRGGVTLIFGASWSLSRGGVLLGSSPHRSADYTLRQMDGARFRHCAVSWLGVVAGAVSARAALNFGAAAFVGVPESLEEGQRAGFL